TIADEVAGDVELDGTIVLISNRLEKPLAALGRVVRIRRPSRGDVPDAIGADQPQDDGVPVPIRGAGERDVLRLEPNTLRPMARKRLPGRRNRWRLVVSDHLLHSLRELVAWRFYHASSGALEFS